MTEHLSLTQTAELLTKKDNILILSHGNPDGDTLGAAFGLYHLLKKCGKKVRFRCDDPVPEWLRFLADGYEENDFSPQFIVAVDVADPKLLGGLAEQYDGKIDLCIDHHKTNKLYAKYTYLDAKASAVCESMEAMAKYIADVDVVIATCFYTGMATDTGCFRYSNVTPRTMRAAARMMSYGVRSAGINEWLFETKTREEVELQRMALNSMKFFMEGKIAAVTVTLKDMKELGIAYESLETIINLTRQVQGVLVGATIKEQKSGLFKVSIRTNGDADASVIAGYLGGGGHQKAAGCTAEGTAEEAEAQVVNACEHYLKSYE